ncbi:MAG: ATP-binding protein [Bacteroidia bacterium]
MSSNTLIHQRNRYINKIKPFIGKGLIKVFIGQRRVGKSYLLFQMMDLIKAQDKDANICYINKEDLSFDFIKTGKDLNDYVLSQKKGKTYVFIDEIQDIVGFENGLRSLLLDDDLDIYCTGSNANLLSADISGFLSGRFIEIVVYSLSYDEFLDFHSLEDSSETLEKYLKFGGLPYLKHLSLENEIVFDYLKNIYSSIVYRDIINRFEVRNVRFLEQLVQFLASNTGSLFSANKISAYLKSQKTSMSVNQVLSYTEYLTNAFLIHKVGRYDIIGKRVFETGEKYYFENLGIRNGIWGYRLEDRGKIIENVVYNHLLIFGYKVSIGVIGHEEIDFVCEKDGEKAYVQVALTIQNENSLNREFGNLQKIKDNYPKWVISLDDFISNSYEGVKHLNLRKFMLAGLN